MEAPVCWQEGSNTRMMSYLEASLYFKGKKKAVCSRCNIGVYVEGIVGLPVVDYLF